MELSDISFTLAPLAPTSSNHDHIEPFDFFPKKTVNFLETLDEMPNSCHEDKEDLTVALHIGLPISSTSASKNSSDHDSSSANLLPATQYWIPTPAQILVGFTHFSCHICNKTFNRYNNLQVR